MSIKPQKSCLDVALDYLTTRMRSYSEMFRYLCHKGFLEEDIDRTIQRLVELKLIDDSQFADELVRAKTAMRPVGRRALDYALRQKGISQEQIGQSLSSYSLEDEQIACTELFFKLVQKHGIDRAGLMKIQRSLLSRGFTYDMIKQAAEQFKERDDWE